MNIDLHGTGDFVISDNAIKMKDGGKFYLTHDRDTILISDSDCSTSNGNIAVCGNNIMQSNGVFVSTKGNEIHIQTKRHSVVYLNGTQITSSDLSETEEDKRVKEFDISDLSINTIKISGSGSLNVESLNIVRDLDIKLSGQGSIDLSDIHAVEIEVKLSGQGNINLNGCSSKKAYFKVSGMGSINGFHNTFESIDKKVSGMGSIHI